MNCLASNALRVGLDTEGHHTCGYNCAQLPPARPLPRRINDSTRAVKCLDEQGTPRGARRCKPHLPLMRPSTRLPRP